MAPPTVNCALVHQLTMEKIPYRCAQRPICGGNSITEVPRCVELTSEIGRVGSLCLFISVTLDKQFSLSESACTMQGQTVYGTLTSGIFHFVLSPIEKYKKLDSPVQVTQ